MKNGSADATPQKKKPPNPGHETGGLLRAQSSASFGVSIQFGDDHRGHVHFVLKGFGLGLAGLPDGGVHHVHNVVGLLGANRKDREERISAGGAEPDLPEVHCGAFRGTHHSVGNLQHLLEQRVLLLVATAGVHDDDLKVLRLELLHAFGRDHHGVHLCVAAHRTQVSTQRPRRGRKFPTWW